ncbi:TPA: hypothetical protein EYG96_03200, partial [Candidatus Gracilibacteria bacterium]|nr:hypothetical protein [Candidatus Gracilibacteria bacterium]
MNIKQIQKSSHFKKASIGVFSVALVGGAIVGVSNFSSLNSPTAEKDYLAEFFQGSELQKSNTSGLKADYFANGLNLDTSLITPYDGPEMSDAVKQCIENAPVPLQEGIFYGKVDMDALVDLMTRKNNGEFTNTDIVAEIIDVFGYAMSKNQINWDWIPDAAATEDSRYEFYVAPGTENMWSCYFNTVETDENINFFPQFFTNYPSSYYTDITLPSNGGIINGHGRRGDKITITTPSGSACETTVLENDTWSCEFDTKAVDGEKVNIVLTNIDENGQVIDTVILEKESAIDNTIPVVTPIPTAIVTPTPTVTSTQEITQTPVPATPTPMITPTPFTTPVPNPNGDTDNDGIPD